MDFSPQPGREASYFGADTGSDLQLVFIPGVFNPEIWRHQVKYFSEEYSVFSIPGQDYVRQKEALEHVLDREDTSNAVIVSQGLGNSLTQEFEYREEVIATVATGIRENYNVSVPRALYNMLWSFSEREPKIFKKMFFSDCTKYRIARNFLEDVEKPDYSVLKSFIQRYSLRKPVKNSLVIHADMDRFSSLEKAQEFQPNVSISVIRNAGSFSFYEKPQEYNKALLDFLQNLEGFVRSREISRTREKNRSLAEFSKPEKKKPKIGK